MEMTDSFVGHIAEHYPNDDLQANYTIVLLAVFAVFAVTMIVFGVLAM
jgi:hypothetical protein